MTEEDKIGLRSVKAIGAGLVVLLQIVTLILVGTTSIAFAQGQGGGDLDAVNVIVETPRGTRSKFKFGRRFQPLGRRGPRVAAALIDAGIRRWTKEREPTA
jgi:hypothetical protein